MKWRTYLYAYCWSCLAIVAVLIMFGIRYENTISTGDLLTIATGLKVSYIVYKWFAFWQRHPFHISVLPGTYAEESPDIPRKRTLSLPIGMDQHILFQATLLLGREMKATR